MKSNYQATAGGLLCAVLTVIAGCHGLSGLEPTDSRHSFEFTLLEEEPSGSRGVLEVREVLESRENPDQWADVVLVGRIGSIEGETWDPDRAVFVMVDSSYVESDNTHESPQHDADNCPFCRANRKKLFASTALVELLDSTGQVPPMHAGKLLGVDEGQTVVLQGEGRIDGLGNLAIRATGVFVPAKGAGL